MNLPTSPQPDRPPRVGEPAPAQDAPAVEPAPAQDAVAVEPAPEQDHIVEEANEGTDALSKKDWILTLLMVSLILVAVVAGNVPQVGAWLASTWVFLNEPTEPSWWQGLMSGLVSALISAAVALLVVFFTVRAQNRGIQKQLETQRHENARVREHEIASRCLMAVRNFAITAAFAKNSLPHDGKPLDLSTAIGETLEEFRINLDSDDTRVIDAFQSLVSASQFAYMDFYNDSTDFYDHPYRVMTSIEALLKIQIRRYVRSTVPERLAMTPFLVRARQDLETMWIDDWRDTYASGKSLDLPSPRTLRV